METRRADQKKTEKAKLLLLAVTREKTGLKLENLGNPWLAPKTALWLGRSENPLTISSLKS